MHSKTVQVGSVVVEDLAFGFFGPRELGYRRRDEPGWGAMVEVAGVARLLQAVTAGEAIAEQVERQLVALAEAAERAVLADEPSPFSPTATAESLRCNGDCPACESKRAELDEWHDEIERRVERFKHHDRYPFAVSGSSIHAITCRTLVASRRARPVRAGRDSELLYRRELHSFTHGFPGNSALPCLPVTEAELQRWRAKRTGTHGGRRYRLCKVCDPQVPLN